MADLRTATKVAQQVLGAADPTLIADGWWGSYTNSAYLRAPLAIQAAVDKALATLGTKRSDLYGQANDITRRVKADSTDSDMWLDETYVSSIIDRAAGKTGLSVDLLRGFLKLEAATRTVAGVRQYNAKSIAPNGLFHGLFQMGGPAWADVQRLGSFPVKSFLEGRYDPWENALAAAQYILINQKYARNAGYRGEFTPEVLYAMHNQGAGGFVKLLKTGTRNANFNAQSGKAKQIIVAAVRQGGGSLA